MALNQEKGIKYFPVHKNNMFWNIIKFFVGIYCKVRDWYKGNKPKKEIHTEEIVEASIKITETFSKMGVSAEQANKAMLSITKLIGEPKGTTSPIGMSCYKPEVFPYEEKDAEKKEERPSLQGKPDTIELGVETEEKKE